MTINEFIKRIPFFEQHFLSKSFLDINFKFYEICEIPPNDFTSMNSKS